MNKRNKAKALEAAKLFLDAMGRPVNEQAVELVIAAFELYADAWEGHGGDIRKWQWPFDILKHSRFIGDEPWTVLLRRAVQIKAGV